MSQDFLGERSRRLLKSLIQEYIQTREPVGSRRLSKLSNESLSPATIRNIMADLEEGGFVTQPHPSAGRIPTEKGYRFYVDALLEKGTLSRQDMVAISDTLQAGGDPSTSHLMSRASHVLSSVSNNVGFVLAPAISDVVMKHIQFVRLADRRVLVILVGDSGMVQNRVIHVEEDMSQQDLEFTSRYMMSHFAGLTLPVIRRQLVALMQEEKALYDTLLQKALKLGNAGCSEEDGGDGDVFVEGAARLMRNPEFADVKRMIEIFEMFEQKSHLVKIITECIHSDGGSPRVTIGLESAAAGAGNFAMVAAPYMYKNRLVGSLGVLGPMRMEYARTIPLVDYVAKVFEGILNRN